MKKQIIQNFQKIQSHLTSAPRLNPKTRNIRMNSAKKKSRGNK